MTATSIIIFATFAFANLAITIAEPSMQIFSKQPPNDTFSVILKASRAVVPEIHDEPFAANYVCNYGGVWLNFREENYTNSAWILGEPGCMQFWYVFNPIHSVWLVESSKNIAIPTINLYPELWWSGVEDSTAFTENQPSYNGMFNSTIVTGSNSFTFYSEPDYRGYSMCLNAGAESTTVYEGKLENMGFKIGEVRSFKFGCQGSNVRQLNGVTMNGQMFE